MQPGDATSRLRRQVAIGPKRASRTTSHQVRALLYRRGMKRASQATPHLRANLLRDESGNVVVGYLFVAAVAIAMAVAVLALASPIGKANELAQKCLAANNP